MNSCCQCQGIESMFDRSTAQSNLKDYRRHGAAKTTRMLEQAVIAAGVQGKSLLDIGGGIGAIQIDLLKAGAAQATDVDASRAYLEAAQEEATRQGLADRVTYHHGNFIDLAPEIPPADIVTLDRVICCYHDMPALVNASASRAAQTYALVYPRDTWWIRYGFPLGNIFMRLRGSHFRFFVHPTAAVEVILNGLGFKRRYRDQTLFWQVAVYGKA